MIWINETILKSTLVLFTGRKLTKSRTSKTSHVSWQENQFEQTGCNSSRRIVDYVSHRRIWVFEHSHSIKFDEIVLRNKTIENIRQVVLSIFLSLNALEEYILQ